MATINPTDAPVVELSVANNAAARLLPGGIFKHIFVDGKVAAGDGLGGGIFMWDVANVTADNDGTILAPSAGGVGRWKSLLLSQASSVNFLQSGAGAVARPVQDDLLDQRVSVLRFATPAQVADYRAGTSTLDMAAAFQAAANASTNIYFPPTAGCKCTAAIAMQNNGKAYGAGKYATRINFWGSDGFTFPTASGGNTVSDMSLYGYTAGGAVDAKTKKGVALNGTAGSHIIGASISNLYLRGWADAVYCAYVNESVYANLETLLCINCIHSFGQCLTNFIAECVLVATGGNASLKLEKDVAVRSEGWTVSNSMMFGGTFGITTDGTLSLRVSNSVIDGITDKGLDLTNPGSSSIIGNWISAANYGVYFADLGVPVDIGSKVIGNDILCSAQNAKNVYVGTNVSGVKVLGNDLIGTGAGGTERLVFVNGSGVLVKDNDFTKASANSSVFINGPGCFVGDSTGSNTAVYNAGASDPTQTVSGAAYAVLATDTEIIANRAGTVTLTLPDPTVSNRKPLMVRTIQAQTVISASANVVPRAGGAAAAAILAAVAGNWAMLQSDGTNWQITAGS